MPSKEAKMINAMFKSMPREPEGTKHDYVAEREQNAKRPMPELPEGITLEETEFDGISGEILRPSIRRTRLSGIFTGADLPRDRQKSAGILPSIWQRLMR